MHFRSIVVEGLIVREEDVDTKDGRGDVGKALHGSEDWGWPAILILFGCKGILRL